jgi:hypothetical protein
MSRKPELLNERQNIVSWLLDVAFGRLKAAAADVARAIHRIGTINIRLKDDDG